MSFVLTAGQAADSPQFAPVLQKVRVPLPVGRPRTRPEAVAADKAYSSRANRSLRKRNIKAVIPEKKNQTANRKRKGSRGGRPTGHDAGLYKERNTVQRLINKLKAWRGIATRYDKTPQSYLAGLHLRASMIWINDLRRQLTDHDVTQALVGLDLAQHPDCQGDHCQWNHDGCGAEHDARPCPVAIGSLMVPHPAQRDDARDNCRDPHGQEEIQGKQTDPRREQQRADHHRDGDNTQYQRHRPPRLLPRRHLVTRSSHLLNGHDREARRQLPHSAWAQVPSSPE
ncbi:hypothetical protein GCM10010277_77850 [Streptomyces longisporoflavus]|nr:hypothetical protein GCM10010277_77850 [Streptomyces longisporoflavus]